MPCYNLIYFDIFMYMQQGAVKAGNVNIFSGKIPSHLFRASVRYGFISDDPKRGREFSLVDYTPNDMHDGMTTRL